ncbi:MAG: site-2 protease family protein [Planctomycetota bacterium]
MFATGSPGKHLFTIFGTPVFGHWTVLLLIFLLGQGELRAFGWIGLAATALAVVAGLLVHEFGHVYAAKTNGFRSYVVLGGMGAYTASEGESRGWRGIWLSVAGPCAGFVFWAVCWFGFAPAGALQSGALFEVGNAFSPWRVVMDHGDVDVTGGDVLWVQLCWINLVWGIFNLMPIVPLDGGHVVEHLLRMRMRRAAAERLASIVSLVVIVLILGLLWQLFGTIPIFSLLILGMMGLQNYERIRGL